MLGKEWIYEFCENVLCNFLICTYFRKYLDGDRKSECAICNISDFDSKEQFHAYVIDNDVKVIVGIHALRAGRLIQGKLLFSFTYWPRHSMHQREELWRWKWCFFTLQLLARRNLFYAEIMFHEIIFHELREIFRGLFSYFMN